MRKSKVRRKSKRKFGKSSKSSKSSNNKRSKISLKKIAIGALLAGTLASGYLLYTKNRATDIKFEFFKEGSIPMSNIGIQLYKKIENGRRIVEVGNRYQNNDYIINYTFMDGFKVYKNGTGSDPYLFCNKNNEAIFKTTKYWGDIIIKSVTGY